MSTNWDVAPNCAKPAGHGCKSTDANICGQCLYWNHGATVTGEPRSETAIPRHDESHGQSASDCTVCEAMAIRVTAPEPIDVHNARKFIHAWGLQQHPDVTRMVPSLATMFHREREAGQHERGRPTATGKPDPDVVLSAVCDLLDNMSGSPIDGYLVPDLMIDRLRAAIGGERRERATDPSEEATAIRQGREQELAAVVAYLKKRAEWLRQECLKGGTCQIEHEQALWLAEALAGGRHLMKEDT